MREAESLILINFQFPCLICVQIFPFPLTFHFCYLFRCPSHLSCVWILFLLPSKVTSDDLCKCSVRNVEIKVEFFPLCVFSNVYHRSLRVISYNKIVQKWKMFFIPTKPSSATIKKKMWFWEWIYRESWKSVCNCLYSKGAGDGEGFCNRISVTSHLLASYFCLFLKLLSRQKMLLSPSFSFWVLG